MKLLTFYLVGYIIAVVVTTARMWKKDFCEEPRWVRLLFAMILGMTSWVLVILYAVKWCYDMESKQKEHEDKA